MSENLNLEELQKLYDFITPPLYYATDESVERGKVLYAKGTEFAPEFVLVHPEDFGELEKSATGRRLVHLRDYPKPEEVKQK